MKPEKIKILATKKVKITKRDHAFEGYTSYYNVKTLSSYNPELEHKHSKPAIRRKLKKILTELRASKFVATSVLDKT